MFTTEIHPKMLKSHSLQAVLMIAWVNAKMRAPLWQCLDCEFIGELTQFGKCAACESVAVTRKIYVGEVTR